MWRAPACWGCRSGWSRREGRQPAKHVFRRFNPANHRFRIESRFLCCYARSMRDDRYHRQRGLALGNSSVVFGLLIVAVGLVFLLQNMGILRHDIWAYWPVVLIIVGGARLLDARSRRAYIWGGTLVLVGLFFLLDNLGILYFNFNLLWPLLLIKV